MTVVRFDTVPDAPGLDAALDGARVALVSVGGAARAELVAVCLERGVAVVARVPFACDAWGAAMLRARFGSRAVRLVPWVPELLDPAVKRLGSAEMRSQLGPSVTATAIAPDERIARVLLEHAAPQAKGVVVEKGEALAITVRSTDPRNGISAAITWPADGNPAVLTVSRGGASRSAVSPARATVDDLARYAAESDRPLESTVRNAAVGPGDGGFHPPVAGDRVAWQSVTDAARTAVTDEGVRAAAGLVRTHGGDAAAAELASDSEQVLPYLEAFAFERGIKPALYLTVPVAEADEVRDRYRDFAIEAVSYACDLDAVTDVRHRRNTRHDEATHVDLFVSRDPSVARRARAIYEDPRGPSTHLAAMGDLLGYPPCCVAAFAALPDRSNNSAIRYAAWHRTHALGQAFAAPIANLSSLVVPFFPCSYACPRAIAHARAVLVALDEAHPHEAVELRRRLARPVFYVDHARQIAFEGAHVSRDGEGYEMTYDRACGGLGPREAGVGERFERVVGGDFALGNSMRIDPSRIEVVRGGTTVARFDRIAPALGVLFPFAD